MPEDTTTTVNKSLEDVYLSGQYDQAIKQLLESKDKYPRGQFHYNLGTLHAKQGDLAVARFHLEKSVRLGFSNTHSWHNLDYVRTKLSLDDLSSSPNFSDRCLESVLNMTGGGLWGLTLLCLIGIAIFVKKSNEISKKILVGLAILAFLPGVFSELYIKKVRLAVALKDGQIHEGPSAIYQSKTSIRAGSKFVIGQMKDGWSFITHPISISGWVRNQDLGIY